MRNWFAVAVPHEDIRRGGFDESVFAAKLGDVASGTAVEDYNDPYTFFRKTYLTDGLRRLLEEVEKRLVEGSGPGVVELQTPFGGGKTHALVTVYHYLHHGDRVSEFLPDGVGLVSDAQVSVVVGTDLNPAAGTTSDGVTRHTLWGEVLYQVGGVEAYRQLEKNDEGRIAPGRVDLKSALEPYQPFVLLFDEVLEYVVKARGVAVEEESLGAQTLSFFNELTEAMEGLPRGLMLVTLPSSDLEDFGDHEQRNLAQLEKIFGRVESIATPVEDDEISSIVRQRLFEPIEDMPAVRSIVDAYFQKYQEHKDKLPPKVREVEYRSQMERAYPFHPDVINILYEKWGTFSSFQRTRGALRLLANVVEELYQAERNLDLILPGDINLAHSEVRREFLRHIGQEYDGMIAADIAGPDAKSQVIDRANRGWKHLAERSATSVFVHSFTAGESDAGATLGEIKLAVLRPETTAPLVTEIIQKLGNELWHLNHRGERYYFSSVPNLNRMILDKKQLASEDEVREEMERRVRAELGSKLRPYLWPASSDALPDNRDLKLAVLDPRTTPSLSEIATWIERRGEGFRAYKNTLFFALPDESRFGSLEDGIRELLALQEIEQEIGEDDRPGVSERRADVDRRLRDIREAIPQRVRELYRTVVVPREGGLEQIDLGQPTIGKENLDSWYWRELTDTSHQKILENPPSPRMLAAKFLSKEEPVALATLLEQFYKDPGLPVPAETAVIAEGVATGVAEGAFGVGAGSASDIKPESVRFGEPPSSPIEFREDLYLLPEKLAQHLKDSEAPVDPGPEGGPEPGPSPGSGPSDGPEPTRQPKVERVPRVAFRASGIPVNKLADLHRGVLRPLSGAVGNFEFTLEIDVSSQDGISKQIVETQIMETLRQLGAEVEEH